MAILEPFIDTLCICTLTGLVILSSGVWTEKLPNNFQSADIEIVAGNWTDTSPTDQTALFHHLTGEGDSPVKSYSGPLEIVDGRLVSAVATVISARSVAEDVVFKGAGDLPITGTITVADGKLTDPSVSLSGRSLLHSAELTSAAFARGLFGEFGRTIVAIGLLLFAFSTAIAWSYYGDRAMVYLFGVGSVKYYRIVYVLGFFFASFSDTTLVWNLAAVAIVLMTLPNLLGILLLRKEMKRTLQSYLAEH